MTRPFIPFCQTVNDLDERGGWCIGVNPNMSPSGLPFGVALMFARHGRCIARKGWPKDCEGGIFMYEGRLVGAPAFILTSEGLALPMKDIMADDWYVLP